MAAKHKKNKISQGLLAQVERLGNALPDPIFLFLFATLLVFFASWLASILQWEVYRYEAVDGKFVASSEQIVAKNLLSKEGIWWILSTLQDNFIQFAPLKAILVGMLGVGLAEKSGVIRACLRAGAAKLPKRFLAPILLFLGIMSSAGLDAGYIILPPLAVAIYRAYNLPAQAGVAAVFAGVSAGFCANLLPTAVDPLLASFTSSGAQVLWQDYQANPLCNWFFAAVSTILLSLVGWWVTDAILIPRLKKADKQQPNATTSSTQQGQGLEPLQPQEKQALLWSGLTALFVVSLYLALVLIPNWPLHGTPAEGGLPRYAQAIVPFIAFLFGFTGITYGALTKSMRGGAQISAALVDSMKIMAPILVLAFFAAQFVEAFQQSNLAEMIAFTGGKALTQIAVPPFLLLVFFIALTMVLNLFVGSMSAKFALLAPVVIPMFILAGISPELTLAAYRIGDSTTNILAPLNPYFIVVLASLRLAEPKAGIGSLMALMVPYSFFFTIAWILLLLLWIICGFPLGLGGELWVAP